MAEDPNAAQSNAARPTGGLALYRKYRPATFAEVRGQEHVTEPLRQALKSGRINHAYLFSGPRGCGKTSSARIMARSLNCVNGPTPDPCGVCESCVALAPSGPGSIDVIEIDAASHGGVDDARDLRDRAFFAPVAGRYKIYIIDEAHMVTPQGFNALLKLVEEPPPHLKFVFATTEPDKVIATIRSRTHHYPFRLMPPSVMSGLLTDILGDEGVPFEQSVIPLVVQAGGGSARDSLSILDQLLAGSDEGGIRYDRAVALLGFTDASLLDEIVAAFAAGDGAGVFGVVNRVIEGGHEPRRFATDMLDRFRDLIVLATVPDAIDTGLLSVPPDRAEPLAAQSKWGVAQLTRAAEIVSNGLDQMRGATSPRLLLELMCAQVLLPAASADERSVLARLERLESQPRASAGAGASDSGDVNAGAPAAAPPPRTRSDGGDAAPAGPPSSPAPPPRAAAPPSPSDSGGVNAGAMGSVAKAPDRAEGPQHLGSSAVDGPGSGRASPAEPCSATGPMATAMTSTRTPSGGGGGGGGAARAQGGGITADVLRQDWPHVLEMIKAKRRVAWMMLQNASVVSLDENVLMLRFPRQGDVKGFTTGQYDEMLKQALQARYGVNLVVRATSGPDTGPGGGGGPRRPAPSPPAPASPASAFPAAPSAAAGGAAPPSPSDSGGVNAGAIGSVAKAPDRAEGPQHLGSSAVDGPGSGRASPAEPCSATGPIATAMTSSHTQPQSQTSGSAGADAGAVPPPPSDSGGVNAGAMAAAMTSSRTQPQSQPRGGAGAPGAASAPSRARSGGDPSRQPGGDLPPFPNDDDFDPDDEDMSSPAPAELSGVGLVQRELGAEIIGEYED